MESCAFHRISMKNKFSLNWMRWLKNEKEVLVWSQAMFYHWITKITQKQSTLIMIPYLKNRATALVRVPTTSNQISRHRLMVMLSTRNIVLLKGKKKKQRKIPNSPLVLKLDWKEAFCYSPLELHWKDICGHFLWPRWLYSTLHFREMFVKSLILKGYK